MAISPWSKATPESPWIRCSGHAFQRFEGEQTSELIEPIWSRFGQLDWQQMHIWQRDTALPGWRDFEPGSSPLVEAIVQEWRDHLESKGDPRATRVNSLDLPLSFDDPVRYLDLILVEPFRWWVGTHVASRIEQTWPGGVYPVQAPAHMISRAYLKIAEAIAWSEFPLHAGDSIVEIGSAPGGACQRLLEMGLRVTGIDPAEMAPEVANHPRFTHWRARSLEIKRRDFSHFRWLACDANVAPNYTLDTVEAIVTYPTSNFQGLILTMKLSEWDQADKMKEHVERVTGWGFPIVRTRQLAYSRSEYCLIASRSASATGRNA